jgi:hypothetical protein
MQKGKAFNSCYVKEGAISLDFLNITFKPHYKIREWITVFAVS